MRRTRPADLVGTTPIWCLDLHWGGTIYRIASEPIDVKADDGAMLSYAGGLDVPRVREVLGRLKFDPPELSATIRALLPVSIVTLRRRGHDWLGATADLYLTVVQTADRALAVPVSDLTHGEMWLQVSGQVRAPRYAAPGTPPGLVEFTLRVAPWDAARQPLIPGDLTINPERYDGSGGLGIGPPPEDTDGKRIPVVFGTPGRYLDDDTIIQVEGSPMYAAERNGAGEALALVACDGHVEADTLEVFDSAGTSATLTTLRDTDALGAPVSYYLPATIDATSTEFYASWDEDGATPSPFSTGVLIRAPEVAAYLLAMSGLAVDLPAWLALDGFLPRLEVSGYVNDESSAWEVLSAHVLPLMPVAYRFTRQGLAPIVYDPELLTGLEVAHVRTVDTPDATGAGDWTPTSGLDLETEPEDVVSVLTVNYAKSAATGNHLRQVVWVGDSGGAPAPRNGQRRRKGDRSGSLYIDQATTRGATSADTLDLDMVWDRATAESVAAWRTRLACMPTESASYSAPLHWGWLRVGDVVLIDDVGKGFTDQPALIESRELGPDGVEFVLVFTEDPVRDARVLD
jgi:hypothetical protein